MKTNEGRLWIGTHGGLSVYEHGRFQKPVGLTLPDEAVVQAMFHDHEGRQWFGTNRGLLLYRAGVTKLFTAQNGLAADDARVIVQSPSGDMWIGGYGGLTRVRNGQFTHWTEADGLPSNNVRSVYADHDGNVWIGTYDGGMARFKDNRFTRYSVRQGLFNNGVFQILEDAHGNLWISCNRGIYRVRKQELNEFADGKRTMITSVAYGKIDGMLNVECNGGLSPAGIKTHDGKLWFPTQNGVAVIDPDAIIYDSQPTPVMIEAALLNRTPVPITGPLRIPPEKENLEIQYTAPGFIRANQTQFKYKLDGLDSDWIDARLAAHCILFPYSSRGIRVSGDRRQS